MESTRTPIVRPRPHFNSESPKVYYRNNELLKSVCDNDMVNINLFDDDNYINDIHNTFKVSRDTPIEEAVIILGRVIGLDENAIKLLIILSRYNFIGITSLMKAAYCACYSVSVTSYYRAYRELVQKDVIYKSTGNKHRGKIILNKRYWDILVNKKRNDKFDTIVFNL